MPGGSAICRGHINGSVPSRELGPISGGLKEGGGNGSPVLGVERLDDGVVEDGEEEEGDEDDADAPHLLPPPSPYWDDDA